MPVITKWTAKFLLGFLYLRFWAGVSGNSFIFGLLSVLVTVTESPDFHIS